MPCLRFLLPLAFEVHIAYTLQVYGHGVVHFRYRPSEAVVLFIFIIGRRRPVCCSFRIVAIIGRVLPLWTTCTVDVRGRAYDHVRSMATKANLWSYKWMGYTMRTLYVLYFPYVIHLTCMPITVDSLLCVCSELGTHVNGDPFDNASLVRIVDLCRLGHMNMIVRFTVNGLVRRNHFDGIRYANFTKGIVDSIDRLLVHLDQGFGSTSPRSCRMIWGQWCF